MNPEVIVPIIAVTLGCLMFLIPIAGFTARFAFKPIVESLAKYKEMQQSSGTSEREVHVLEQRVALLEQQYQTLENSMARLGELRDFDKQLGAGS